MLALGAERASAPFPRGHEAAERDQQGGFASHLARVAATLKAHENPWQLLHRPAVAFEEVPHDAEILGRQAGAAGAEACVGHAGGS